MPQFGSDAQYMYTVYLLIVGYILPAIKQPRKSVLKSTFLYKLLKSKQSQYVPIRIRR